MVVRRAAFRAAFAPWKAAMPHKPTRRNLLAGAAATAACAAFPAAAAIEAVKVTPVEWPSAPFVDRQTFFDGRVDWTFYARRREWVGCDRVEDTA